MHALTEGVEECGRVALLGALLSQINLASESPLWSAIFRSGVVQGYSPFKSGLAAGYVTSLAAPQQLLRQSLAGGLFGVGVALVSRAGTLWGKPDWGRWSGSRRGGALLK